MAYNEVLAERIALFLESRKIGFETKKMFGGVCFMVDDKMCVGVLKDSMMLRIDPTMHGTLLKKEGCREMDFTKRPMRGMVFVDSFALETDRELGDWIQIALEFNPRAKASKKK